MISNAKIRINLKEAKKQAKKSLTNPRKDWEIRIFKGFLYKYGTRTKSTFSGKSQGTSHKYTPYLLIFTGAKVIFFFWIHQGIRCFCGNLIFILALFYSAFLRYLVGVFYETSASRTDMSVLLVIENEFDNFDNFCIINYFCNVFERNICICVKNVLNLHQGYYALWDLRKD